MGPNPLTPGTEEFSNFAKLISLPAHLMRMIVEEVLFDVREYTGEDGNVVKIDTSIPTVVEWLNTLPSVSKMASEWNRKKAGCRSNVVRNLPSTENPKGIGWTGKVYRYSKKQIQTIADMENLFNYATTLMDTIPGQPNLVRMYQRYVTAYRWAAEKVNALYRIDDPMNAIDKDELLCIIRFVLGSTTNPKVPLYIAWMRLFFATDKYDFTFVPAALGKLKPYDQVETPEYFCPGATNFYQSPDSAEAYPKEALNDLFHIMEYMVDYPEEYLMKPEVEPVDEDMPRSKPIKGLVDVDLSTF